MSSATRILNSAILLAATAATTACGAPRVTDLSPATASATPSPTATEARAARWVRGSLAAPYQLLPKAEYSRVADIGFSDADYGPDPAAFPAGAVTAAAKIDEISRQIATERGEDETPIIDAIADDGRSSRIPFRGNPADAKLVRRSAYDVKVYVPLGGDLMTPGNEVSVAAVGARPAYRTRIHVGVRPQRLAVYRDELVFVCNQYSDYVSIIDASQDVLLAEDQTPIEVKTEYFCADLAIVAGDDADHLSLWVANRWRRALLRYDLTLARDANGHVTNVSQAESAASGLPSKPSAAITGVGSAPNRLRLDDAGKTLFVASNRGGELARVDAATGTVETLALLNAPTIDVETIGDLVFVPTTMRDRGLLDAADADSVPSLVKASPVTATGLDGASHVVHPGAMFDGTKSYNFEDVRNGLFQLDAHLASTSAVYYTDDVSAEPNFSAEQKILAGALPQAITRNAAGTRLYVALGGSGLVQELAVSAHASLPYKVTPTGRTFATGKRPFAVALDESNGELFVANWGSETLQQFDLNAAGPVVQPTATVNLGYEYPGMLEYPATRIEKGEYYFYDASWSNDGRKACATCHVDELVADGIGFSNGATAPTAYHQVKPNHNLLETDGYFWNGAFANGSYRSVAFAAQMRPNCEIVAFGLVEGPASDPATRVGNPRNAIQGNDAACRPQAVDPVTGLPANFLEIATEDALQKATQDAHVSATTTFASADDLSNAIDAYGVAELRLPPDPEKTLFERAEVSATEEATLTRGKALFEERCAYCHEPATVVEAGRSMRARNVGTHASWIDDFVSVYQDDPLVTQGTLGALPEPILRATEHEMAITSVNVDAYTVLDYFDPFCFDRASCLSFADPMSVRSTLGPDSAEEARRMSLLVRFNLGDPKRGWIPGLLLPDDGVNPVVAGRNVTVNVPSLRGAWTQSNLLHHGLARSVREAILGPGHASLRAGETGFAAGQDSSGTLQLDSHGRTSDLGDDDVGALEAWVLAIE